jgi:ferritin
MLKKKVERALNEQLNEELYSAYMYLSLAAYFRDGNYDGFGGWMRAQAQEEVEHGMKFYDYINDRAGRVTLAKIDAPPTDWASPEAAFEAAWEHEKKITGLINDLVDLASKERDHATHQFLQWFVVEQVEEEDLVGSVVHKIKMVADSPSGMYILDRELATRNAGA